MVELRAPGLTADSLNGWLAAVGATVLVHGCRLAWSDSPRPVAVLTTSGDGDPCASLTAAVPSLSGLEALAIANRAVFPRTVSIAHFSEAARRARAAVDDGSLALSVTDLVPDDQAEKLPHSRFDVGAPHGETLWTRLRACRALLPESPEELVAATRATLQGRAVRQDTNGLGFDVRRLEAGDPPIGGKFVDALAEILAFYGLYVFPVRGDGHRATTRGWSEHPVRGRRYPSSRFMWPAWSAPLDRWGIDALLGRFFADAAPRSRRSLGIVGVYEAVVYQKTGDMDQTAGFGSRRV